MHLRYDRPDSNHEIDELSNLITARVGRFIYQDFPMLTEESYPTLLKCSRFSLTMRFEEKGDQRLLKIFAPDSSNPDQYAISKQRFGREIQIQQTCSEHTPSIPKILQVLKDPNTDQPYAFVSEYIQGQALDELISDREYTPHPKTYFPILHQVLRTLKTLEDLKILHRDIKPSNLIIGDNGIVYLIDFGLARDRQDPNRITYPGTRLGSPFYISPEVSYHGAVDYNRMPYDRYTDIYSFGALAYSIFKGSPSQIAQPPQMPEELWKMVSKAMNPNAFERYRSFSAILDDLDNYLLSLNLPLELSPQENVTPEVDGIIGTFKKWLNQILSRPTTDATTEEIPPQTNF